jgi:CubicO group peptidase (beta-lactamase class C family)
MDHASEVTGYGFSFGYVDNKGLEFGLGSGNRTFDNTMPQYVAGNVTEIDTMELGSGTKPFTATAVMRLVDQGKVKLDDPAHIHIDPPLKAGWNTTMYELFGLYANNVTVHNLIFMQSGINDYEVGDFDQNMLLPNESHSIQDPMVILKYLAELPAKSPCLTDNCTWSFYPGTHTQYSSTNFVLAGFILVNHAPEGQNTWDTFDMFETLGLNKADYPHLYFKPTGRACDNGLTVPGTSLAFGKAEIYAQDASIMGWTCGYATAAAKDIAKFYYDLLGPEPKIVSDELRQLM